MPYKKTLVVTAGEAAAQLTATLPQLIAFFAGMQNQSIRIVNADPEDASFNMIFECDRIKPGAPADLGGKIVEAYRETDLLLIYAGRSLSNVNGLLPLLISGRAEAENQGRLAVALLPCAFGGSPSVIQIPDEAGALAAEGYKVRIALFADRTRRASHLQCIQSKSLIPYGSVPPLGKGLADLIQLDGPTLTAFLANTRPGYGFAANHIRSWLNHCIDGRVFDDMIANDQLVPGTDQVWSEHRMRRALVYQYDRVSTIQEAHDDELFKRYHQLWSNARDIMASAT